MFLQLCSLYAQIIHIQQYNTSPYKVQAKGTMQKYRRWTDEATGINPFIVAKRHPTKIYEIFLSAILALVKIHIIFIILLPLVLSLTLNKYLSKIPALSTISKLPIKILLVLVGLWGVDDNNFGNYLDKNRTKNKLIISNSICILDALYFMTKIDNVKFIISEPSQKKFKITSGLQVLIKLLTQKQPFFQLDLSQKGLSLEQLVAQQLPNNNLVLFYQGIRTNGLGTIKISSNLSEQVYNLQKDLCIVHLKYTSAPQGLFSTVSMPLVIFLVALGALSISLKVRCNPINIEGHSSGSDVQKDIDSFLMANAAKLLDTSPQSYYEFLQFYYKTQGKEGYSQLTSEQTKKQ